MRDRIEICQNCTWPLENCPEADASAAVKWASGCPREAEVWRDRMGENRLTAAGETDESPLVAAGEKKPELTFA
jgi:hypothetical protein